MVAADLDEEDEDREVLQQMERGATAATRLREEVEAALEIKEPEVDPKIYEPVERMLFRGFLTQPANINGTPFVFKSLNQHEFEHLSWFSEDPKRYHSLFLSYCVFMVDGLCVLPSRQGYIDQLTGFFHDLPEAARRKMVRHLSEVNRKAANAVTLAEAYAMEQYSRFRWHQTKGLDITSTAVTGIVGTNQLGLNWAQLVWRALNGYEDAREDGERDWDNSKFVGGCLAGKGIQKVYNQDRDRRKKEREERITRKDRLLRQVLLGEDPTVKGGGRIAVQAAQTVDDLITQLEQDLRGEKDWHDQVVSHEETRMKRQYEERHTQLQVVMDTRQAEFGDANIIGSSEVGLSLEEAQTRIAERRRQANLAPAPEDPRMTEFHDKWGTYQPGDLADRDPSSIRPIGNRPRK